MADTNSKTMNSSHIEKDVPSIVTNKILMNRTDDDTDSDSDSDINPMVIPQSDAMVIPQSDAMGIPPITNLELPSYGGIKVAGLQHLSLAVKQVPDSAPVNVPNPNQENTNPACQKNVLTVEPFQYTLTLINETIQIDMVHLVDFHQWSKLYKGPEMNNDMQQPIQNSISSSSSSVAIEITPEIIFNMFDDYKNNKLDDKKNTNYISAFI